MNEIFSLPTINRKAIIAFLCALFALFSLCMGVAPIPFLELVCYPSGLLLGIAAVVLGLWAQYEIRMGGGNGKTIAVISVWAGGFTILAVSCIVTIGVLVLPRIYDYLTQIIDRYDLNPF